MNIFFLCILFIASCRTQSFTNVANDATLADNIDYLRENLIPFRNFDGTSITGTGELRDPFVVKCKDSLTLFHRLFTDRILLIRDKSKAGTWKLSIYPYDGGIFSPYSEINIEKLTEFDRKEFLSCIDNSDKFSKRISSIKKTLIPNRNLDPEDISGTGNPKDPFVVKCIEGYTLPNLHHYNTIILVYQGWLCTFLDFTLEKTNSKRFSSPPDLLKKKDDGTPDDFTCQPEENKTKQKCDLTSFQNSKKLTTHGMQQIPSSEDTKFHISCVENTEEIAVYCKTTNTIVEKNKNGDDSPIDTKEMERRCNVFNNIDYLKYHFTSGRNLDPAKITGSGEPKDPFVLKCREGYTLPEMNHYNTIQLLFEENVWSLLDYTFNKTNSKRSSTVEIGPKIKTVEDRFTCQLATKSGEPDVVQMCYIDKFDNTNSKTYGMKQIPHQSNVIFYLSCAQNKQEFGLYCNENGFIMDAKSDSFNTVITPEEIQERCDSHCNYEYLDKIFIPGRNFQTEPTGKGQPKDPFVVKCIEGYTLPEMNHYNTVLLLCNENDWKLLNLNLGKNESHRSTPIDITTKTVKDRFTCEVAPESGNPGELQMCDIGEYDNNNSKTYGMEQIPHQNNVIFYVSCAKNSQEFGIYCNENGKLMDRRYGLTEMEISFNDIEKRCIICPLKDLWQKILPMNMILSPREAEKYLLKCRVNYAKIADKELLEAKCSDEGEWEVYQLDTGIKVEFENIYCERFL